MIHVYGIEEQLEPRLKQISDVINGCMVDALSFPENKRCHRFFPMKKQHWFAPQGRTDAYTLIEIRMMTGRSVKAKKCLVRLLFDRLQSEVGLEPNDVEVCIIEARAENWGFRGLHGDEAQLNYRIDV